MFDVLVFGAHPDDAEMGMGGTIAKLTRSGRRVLIVCMTHGECSTFGTPENREKEAARAAEILGCERRLLSYHDTKIVHDQDSRQAIMQILREYRPKLVFSPYHTNTMGHHDGAGHVDHVATGAIVRDAVKVARLQGLEPETPAHDVQRLLYYMVPRNVPPSLVVDVGDDYGTLSRAIQAYESQMAIERRGKKILEILELYRRNSGMLAGIEYGEPFLVEEVLRPSVDMLFSI